MSDTDNAKAKRERSKAYPGAPLEDCARYIALIKKGLGRGTHDRDSLAKAMGFSSVSGAVSPKIAALVHFGFLNRTGDGYELSEESKSVTDAIDDQERMRAIRSAFSKPTLYQEILSKFEYDGMIPNQLATHLHRFHGITDTASTSAADIFIASGRFAGVIDQDNRILASSGAFPSDAVTVPPIVAKQDTSDAARSEPPAQTVPISTVPALANHQRFEFTITRGRTVVLVVPSELNAKDIKVIRKQIELLELQAGLDDDAE